MKELRQLKKTIQNEEGIGTAMFVRNSQIDIKRQKLFDLAAQENVLVQGQAWTGDFLIDTLKHKVWEPWQIARSIQQDLAYTKTKIQGLTLKIEKAQKIHNDNVANLTGIKSRQDGAGGDILQTAYGDDLSRFVGTVLQTPAHNITTQPTAWGKVWRGADYEGVASMGTAGAGRLPPMTGTFGGVKHQLYDVSTGYTKFLPDEHLNLLARRMKMGEEAEYAGGVGHQKYDGSDLTALDKRHGKPVKSNRQEHTYLTMLNLMKPLNYSQNRRLWLIHWKGLQER